VALWGACSEVLLPAARRFQPQLILVSAGFDAAGEDPLGGCSVTPKFFGALTVELRRLAAELCGGRVVFALEGGYNPEVLADCVEEVSRALLAAPPEGAAFAEEPTWLTGGSACRGPIRKTCEAHESLPLKLSPPLSKNDRRKAKASGACSPLASPEAEPSFPVSDARSEDSVGGTDAAAVPITGSATIAEDATLSDPEIPIAVSMEPGLLVVRMSPVPKPTDVAMSTGELRVVFRDSTRYWRFEGMEIDNAQATNVVEYRPKRHELTLRLPMGAILGGSVSLTPIT